MSSRVFITGVAGFLGSHLADRLLRDGHEIIGIDNFLGGHEDNIPKGVQFHKIDARDLEKLKPLMKGVEVVYHCAAAPHEGLSVFSPDLVTQHTYNSSIATLTASIVNNVKRFVFCSSMARYGKQERLPFTEDMPPRPQDPYGIAKYASELTIESLCDAHGMEYAIAIPHNIIGPRQKYDDPFRNVASIMANLMLQGSQPIIYGNGDQKRGFSYVQDVTEPLVKLGFDKVAVGEAINIGPDEEFTTINELARRLASIIGFKELQPIYHNPRPLEVKFATCSADKARKLLGYKTTYSLDDALTETVEWIRRRGPKPFIYHLPLEIINKHTPSTWKDRLF